MRSDANENISGIPESKALLQQSDKKKERANAIGSARNGRFLVIVCDRFVQVGFRSGVSVSRIRIEHIGTKGHHFIAACKVAPMLIVFEFGSTYFILIESVFVITNQKKIVSKFFCGSR